jgi:predicted transcriptional regulator
MSKKLVEIASEIVQTQVSLSSMSAGEIATSLRQVFRTLQDLQKAEVGEFDIGVTESAQGTAPEESPKQIKPENSILDNKVICLECGAEMKQLTQKHLAVHGMSPKEYRKKYGFTMRTPLAAKSLIKARSKAAKKRGLPEKLRIFIETRRQEKAAAAAQAAEAPASVTDDKPKATRLRKKKAGV